MSSVCLPNVAYLVRIFIHLALFMLFELVCVLFMSEFEGFPHVAHDTRNSRRTENQGLVSTSLVYIVAVDLTEVEYRPRDQDQWYARIEIDAFPLSQEIQRHTSMVGRKRVFIKHQRF